VNRKVFSILLFLIVLGGDFFFKAYVAANLPLMSHSSSVFPYGGLSVFHDWHGIDFSINHVVNKGMAWGKFAQWQIPILILRILMILGICGYLFFSSSSAKKRIPLTLIISGAVGNVLDYFLYGHVVDMFHFKFWGYTYPLFNIADSAIFCGVIWIFLSSFNFKRILSRV
jgi:signal peptidase II